MTQSPLAAHVSVFQGSTNTTPVETVPLSVVLQRIQDGRYQQNVERLRRLLAGEDDKAYRAAKEQSMAFTPCCALRTRVKNVSWDDKLLSVTGIVHFDSDHVDDPEDLKHRMAQDPCLVFAFVSPSAHGLKIGIAASGITGPDDYKHAWQVMLDHLKQTYPGVHLNEDRHVKYLNALCYVSYDPTLYTNSNAIPFLVPPAAPKPALVSRGIPDPSDYTRVASALATIPNNDAPYDDWLMLGMALHSTGEPWARDLWDGWSRQSAKFDDVKQDKSWRSFSSDGTVTIASLFHLAKQAGWRPPGATRRGNGTPPQARVVPDMTGDRTPPASADGADPAAPSPGRLLPRADALPYSDYTNALALVRDHGKNLRYCHPWKSWLTWVGTHWHRDDSGVVMRAAKSTIKRLARHAEDLDDAKAKALMKHVKESLGTSKLKAMIESAQSESEIPVQPEDLDADPWLLNCTNGTLDLKTGTSRLHERTDLLTQGIPVAYDPQAQCPTWDAFLHRIMAGNKNLIDFLQRAVGYALTGVIREHVLLILWGAGRNGKSTFLNAILALLCQYGLKAPSELLMVSQHDRHPTEKALLYGKRFIVTIETEQGRRLAEAFVKEATGGDPITARRLYEDPWTFWPTHKVFLATNHKPVIKGTDNAIWERIRLIPFTVTIPKNERDTTLPDKLQAELPGILAWAVRGCLAWQQDGLGEPDEVQQATAGYRTEMDVLGQFITECCVVGPNYRTKAAELYEAYKRWRGDGAEDQRIWGMALTERGYERKRGTAGRHWWLGIGLVDYSTPPTKDSATQVTAELPKSDPSSAPWVTQDGQGNTPRNEGSDPSDPKNGIHQNPTYTREVNRKSGSLGSLGSLAVNDWVFLLSADGVRQNAVPYLCKALEQGGDGHWYARFLEIDTSWPVELCEKADDPPPAPVIDPPLPHGYHSNAAVDGPSPSSPGLAFNGTSPAPQSPQTVRAARQLRSVDTRPDAGACPTPGCPGRLKRAAKGKAVFCMTCRHRAWAS